MQNGEGMNKPRARVVRKPNFVSKSRAGLTLREQEVVERHTRQLETRNRKLGRRLQKRTDKLKEVTKERNELDEMVMRIHAMLPSIDKTDPKVFAEEIEKIIEPAVAAFKRAHPWAALGDAIQNFGIGAEQAGDAFRTMSEQLSNTPIRGEIRGDVFHDVLYRYRGSATGRAPTGPAVQNVGPNQPGEQTWRRRGRGARR